MFAIQLAERGWLPDSLIRKGIRRLLGKRLQIEAANGNGAIGTNLQQQPLPSWLRDEAVAVATGAANEQHYEVPSEFFQTVLGPRLKYSCGIWSDPNTTLAGSETDMLSLTAARAEIEDGMRILDLGCGWGSFSIWAAEAFPNSQIVAVSNSSGQKRFIDGRCQARGLTNVEVITANIADFEIDQRFDRAVSVEMFEHVRNHGELLRRISTWLVPSGKLFVHVFCHRHLTYPFVVDGKSDWMARHFFTGGIMPSADLLAAFQDHLKLTQQWQISGQHYAATCEAWLQKLDNDRAAALATLETNNTPTRIQLQRWRIFFLACAELFAYNDGEEWFVSHYLFEKE